MASVHGMLGYSDWIALILESESDTAAGLISDISATLSNDTSDVGSKADQMTYDQTVEICDILLNVSEGSYYAKDLITRSEDVGLESLDSIEGGLKKILKIFYESIEGAAVPDYFDSTVSIRNMVSIGNAPIQGTAASGNSLINANPSAPERNSSPALSAIQIQAPRISLASRDCAAVSFFMNSIPVMEISRAVPYVDLKFITDTPMVNRQGKITGMSLIRFLGQTEAGDDNPISNALATAQPAAVQSVVTDPSTGLVASAVELVNTLKGEGGSFDSSLGLGNVSTAGLELFCSPQLLVNANIHDADQSQFSAPVLDRFRPFMSLNEVRINVYSAGSNMGLMNCRRLFLNITLHDRSRLSEIAPLISAGSFNLTSVILNCGWSHGDGAIDSENIYARFLNSLRLKGEFTIEKSDYKFTQNGEVDINIKLGDKATNVCRNASISTGYRVDTTAVIASINKAISAAQHSITRIPDVMPLLILKSPDVTDSLNTIPSNLNDEIQAVINSYNSETPGDIGVLVSTIKSILGEEASAGLAFSIFEIINDKLANLNAKNENETYKTEDPWIDDINQGPNLNLETYSSETFRDRDNYASFGKAVMSFVGAPLAATKKFDEVQVIFYSFNDSAGAYHGASIATFPLKILEIRKRFEEKTKNSRNLSIWQAFDILSSFVDDESATPYGIVETDVEQVINASPGAQEQPQTVPSQMSERLRSFGCDSPEFITPDITYYLETVPANVVDSEGGIYNLPGRTVAKIHVFDKTTSPNSSEKFLLQASQDKSLAILYNGVDSGQSSNSSDSSLNVNAVEGEKRGFLSRLQEKDLLSFLGSSKDASVISVQTQNENIKRLISNTVPTIKFGVSNTAINNISINGTTSGEMADIFMYRAYQKQKEQNPEQGQGASDEIGDIHLIPASIDLDSLGCPLINYAQEFFIDMGTGTSVDSIYAVNGLTHTLSPGSFTTRASLQPTNQNVIKSYRDMLEGAVTVIEEISEAE